MKLVHALLATAILTSFAFAHLVDEFINKLQKGKGKEYSVELEDTAPPPPYKEENCDPPDDIIEYDTKGGMKGEQSNTKAEEEETNWSSEQQDVGKNAVGYDCMETEQGEGSKTCIEGLGTWKFLVTMMHKTDYSSRP